MPFKGVFGFFCGEHMAITISETEPLEFYSGETVKWKRTDLSDYPAPTWTLNYFLQKSGTKIDFASSQDGSTTGHLISLTPATTAAYTVGIYHWIVEARDGLDSEEQKVLQEAKLVFGGAIYTAENFNKYFPTRKGRING